MWRARRRCPASSATSRSSSATCSTPRAISAPRDGDRPLCRLARCRAGGRALYRARDDERDQSYFLFATTPEQLDALRFPLGDLHQGARRASLRASSALSIADKQDSQDICFVPQRPLYRHHRAAACRARRRRATSSISTAACSAATRHHPFHRRPAARASASPAAEPLYVVRLDADARRVVVGPREALAHARDPAARRELDRRRPDRGHR